eukprot:TRINITY_DN8516_c0_g1_i1.p1 TRINITY_DN8516_c0_g1~~TRINITY_DN8516_c0_g1_i1.p1  ORF type:complete len:1818 (-),score=465.35 TRINITY_DN8516_c0_g1_i1:168-5621(-)
MSSTLEKLQRLSKPYNAFPDFLKEASAAEAKARVQGALEDLRNAEASAGLLGYALKRVEDTQLYQGWFVEEHSLIGIELWKLLLNPSVMYRIRRTAGQSLHRILRGLRKQHTIARGMKPLTPQQVVLKEAAGPLGQLRETLSWKRIQDLMLDELEITFRGATPQKEGRPGWSRKNASEQFVDDLVPLLQEIRHWTPASEAQAIVDSLRPWMDPAQRSSVLFGQLMIMAMPTEVSERYVTDGFIFDMMRLLPAGANPRYTLCWYSFLARAVKVRWASGQPRPAEMVIDKSRMMLIMDSLSHAMSLFPPTQDGLADFAIDFDWAFRGTAFRFVAKFFAYSLEPLEDGDQAFKDGSMWAMLEIFLRRLTPMIAISRAHYMFIFTFLQEFTKAYYVRICRERFAEPGCTAHESFRLNAASDDAFIRLLWPLFDDSFNGNPMQGGGDHAAFLVKKITTSMVTVMRIALFNEKRWEPIQNLLTEAVQELENPESQKRDATLHILKVATPFLVYTAPDVLIEGANLALQGIDANDTGKTDKCATFFVALFMQVPMLDLSAVDLPDSLPDVITEAYPAPPGGKLVPGANAGTLAIQTSFLPDLCRGLLERYFDYVSNMPKPSKRDTKALHDIAGPRVLATALFLAAKQSDQTTADSMIDLVADWVRTSLVPSGVKATSMLISSMCLAHQKAAGRFMDNAMKKLSASKSEGQGLAGLGESEALWHLAALSAACRFAGPLLPPRKDALMAAVAAANDDKRKVVRRAGAKLVRRILSGLLDPYSGDLLLENTKEEAVKRWMGARAVQMVSGDRRMEFHVPSSEELAFAEFICNKMLEDIKTLAAGTDEAIHSCLCQIKSLMRGVDSVYPDERQQGEAGAATVTVMPVQNNLRPKIFNEVSTVLMSLCAKLSSPCHPLEPALESSNRPNLLCKALRIVLALVSGERRPEVCDLIGIRGFEGSDEGRLRIAQELFTDKVHWTSAWRDCCCLWQRWEVVSALNRRLRSRPLGFKFEGARRKLGELLACYCFHENEKVSLCASECLNAYMRLHYGAKTPLYEGTIVPMQEKTIAAAATISADKSHLVEAALKGPSEVFRKIFLSMGWKKNIAQALKVAALLVRTVHAFTEDGKCKVDLPPDCMAMQFELLGLWSAHRWKACTSDPKPAVEAAGEILAILKLPGVHWRTKICVLSVASTALRILHLAGVEDIDANVLKKWISEVLTGFAPGAPAQLSAFAVAELTAALSSAMKRPNSTLASVLKELLPSGDAFLKQVVRATSGLHEGHVGNDGAKNQEDAVHRAISEPTAKKNLPALSWGSNPNSQAWAHFASFFQSYVSFRHRRGDATLIEDIKVVLQKLHEQPKSEREDHVTFIELLAGAIRALRKAPAAQLSAFWAAVGSIAAEEMRGGDEESSKRWEHLVAFASIGMSKRLRPKATEANEDAALLRLVSFIVAAPGDDSGQIKLETIATNGEEEASSHAHVIKLRLLMVVCHTLKRRRPKYSAELRHKVVDGIVEACKAGTAHPYMQVHQMSAKVLLETVLVDSQYEGAKKTKAWLVERAAALADPVRTAAKDSTEINACTGLVYVFCHGLQGRRLRTTSMRCLNLIVAASTCEDESLRQLSKYALRCFGFSYHRDVAAAELAQTLVNTCNVPDKVNDAARTIQLQEAAGMIAAGAMIHYYRMFGEPGAAGAKMSTAALMKLLGDQRTEVRTTARKCVMPLLSTLGPDEFKQQVMLFKTLDADMAVQGLGAMLSVAGILGIPPWLGAVVEALNVVARKPEVKKDVERIVQDFMKQQQQSREMWKRCQTRLTEKQMELLKDRQGTMSYYS